MKVLIARKDLAQERYNVCKTCPAFKPVVRVCNRCNCFMPVKVKFAQAACPAGRWPALGNVEDQQHDPYPDLE